MYHEYAYAPRDEKVDRKMMGRKFQLQYNGTTDEPLFEQWFEQWLLPCFPQDTVKK